MTATTHKLSIVCPAYEEEEVLPRFHAELIAVLDRLGPDFEAEIIYVDDGSRDGTLAILRRLAERDGRVRYLSLSRNFGNQAALTAGLEQARGDVVITMDSDLQHPPAVIPELLARWREGYDVVLTMRDEYSRERWFKRCAAGAFFRVMRLLSSTDIRAELADFRLLSRKAADALLRLPETHRFIRGLVNWVGFASATVTFTVADRGAGVSKFTLRRLMNLGFDALLSFSKVPLRLALLLSLAALALAAALTAAALLHVVLSPAPTDWGWYALMVAGLLVGGAVLGSLGVLGEYVGRIFDEVKGRPLFLIKEASPAAESGAGRRDDAAAA
jgi:dolichol-phosphate mannosyltransferase